MGFHERENNCQGPVQVIFQDFVQGGQLPSILCGGGGTKYIVFERSFSQVYETGYQTLKIESPKHLSDNDLEQINCRDLEQKT